MKVGKLFVLVGLATFGLAQSVVAQETVPGSFEKIYEKYAVSGKKIVLTNFYVLRPDCSSIEIVDFAITKQPEHGSVSTKESKAPVFYPKDNPRSSCNGKNVASKLVEYLPSRDYKGEDSVEGEVITGVGERFKSIFKITVK